MNEIHVYLIFNGNCRQAMEFYAQCFETQLLAVPFSDMPDGKYPPEAKDRLMHARISKGKAVLMASDNMPGMPFHAGDNYHVSVGCESIEESEKLFTAFSQGAKAVKMPLQETFWATRFGMLTDRFGVHWMFNMDKPH